MAFSCGCSAEAVSWWVWDTAVDPGYDLVGAGSCFLVLTCSAARMAEWVGESWQHGLKSDGKFGQDLPASWIKCCSKGRWKTPKEKKRLLLLRCDVSLAAACLKIIS